MKKIVGPLSTKNQDRVRAQWEEVYLHLNVSKQKYLDAFDIEMTSLFADKDVDESTARYQNLVSLMLSALTKVKINEGIFYISCYDKAQEARFDY